jgi:hypothetical protein
MSVIVIKKTGRLPIRSAKDPKTAAPMGRNTIPTPKVAKLASKLLGDVASPLPNGKNKGPNWIAKAAKQRKSYHSKKVPKQAAKATLRYFFEVFILYKLLILLNLLSK